MRGLILLLCLLAPLHVLAYSKHAPLPTAVTSAKNIYIDNQSGAQQTTDEVYEAITKWGRFTVAQTKAEADLVLTFTKSSALYQGTTVDSVDMVVTRPDSKDSLFEDHELAKGFHLPNNRIGLSARKCVDKFKQRFD